MTNKKIISYLLRGAVAFAFLYPPVAAFFNPDGWIWFVPDMIENFMPRTIFLHIFGGVEIVIAFGILFLRNPFYPTFAAIGVLASIVVIDWTTFDVVFRDVSILLAAVALIFLHREESPQGDTF